MPNVGPYGKLLCLLVGLGEVQGTLIMDRLVLVSLFLTVSSALTLVEPVDLPGRYARSPSGKPLTEEDRTELDKGKILVQLSEIPGTRVKRSQAVALIDAAPEQVFGVLTDYAEFPHFVPYCKKVELKKTEGDRAWVRFELDFPWPIGDRHYVVRLTDRCETDSGTTIWASRWTYEPNSGNINDTYGSWEVLAYKGGRSFIRYTVFTDSGGKLPNWARNMGARIAVTNVIRGVRKRVAEKTKPARNDPAAPSPIRSR